jgi:alpha-glucosidase
LFVYGTYDLVLKKDRHIYAYTRTLGKDKALIICNLSNKTVRYQYKRYNLSSKKLLLHNYPVEPHRNVTTIDLKPWEARVYKI